ncbi:MAG: copper-binding protein [Polyangiales bacterium]
MLDWLLPHRPHSASTIRAAVLSAVLLTAACGRGGASQDKPAATYRVRAEVVHVDAKAGELTLRHEAIDPFVDSTGKKVGMPAMVMPFQVTEHLRPASRKLRAGTKLQLRFQVRWQPEAELRIVAWRKLPAHTTLSFDASQHGAAAQHQGDEPTQANGAAKAQHQGDKSAYEGNATQHHGDKPAHTGNAGKTHHHGHAPAQAVQAKSRHAHDGH